jgi:hypothetical protein
MEFETKRVNAKTIRNNSPTPRPYTINVLLLLLVLLSDATLMLVLPFV